MMYATAGNLDTFIQARCSASPATAALNTDGDSFAQLSKAERIKAYKRRRASLASDGGSAHAAAGEQRGVILLSKEEIGKLFGDVVDGLAYLVSVESGADICADDESTPTRFSTLTSNAQTFSYTGKRAS